MKYVTFWYKCFMCCEEFVPILHSVKFTVQQCYVHYLKVAMYDIEMILKYPCDRHQLPY